jgi:hypothetical protein
MFDSAHMLKLKCEKCGARKANFRICKKCGRTNPCPTKKLILQVTAPLLFIAIIAGAVWSATWVAEMRRQKAVEGATSFVAPREPRPPGAGRGGGGGGRRGGGLTWR